MSMNRFVSWVEGLYVTPAHLIATFLFIGLFRIMLEDISFGGGNALVSSLISITSPSFYFALYFLFLFFLGFLIKKISLQNWVFVALFLGLAPPLIDMLLFNHIFDVSGRGYTYFNSFEPDFFAPYQMIGESVTLWVTMIITAFIVWLKTKSVTKSIIGFVITWCLLQFSLYFSFTVTGNAWLSQGLFLDSGNDVHGGILSLLFILTGSVCMVACYWDVFKATVGRIHHSLVFGLLVVVGSSLISASHSFSSLSPLVWAKALVFTFAFILAQAENDYYDKRLDATTPGRQESGIQRSHMCLVRFLQIILVLSVAIFDFSAIPFLLLFFTLSFAYSHTAIRLKKNFVGGSLVEGLLCFSSLMAGAYSVYGPTVSDHAVLLLFVLISTGFALCSNFKDYKDFEGDRKEGITTLYVFLCRMGIAPRITNYIICLFLICSFATLITVTHHLYAFNHLWLVLLAALPSVLVLLFVKSPRLCVGMTIFGILVFFITYSFCIIL